MVDYIYICIGICSIIVPIFLFVRKPWKADTKVEKGRELLYILFLVYLCVLFALTLRGYYETPNEMLKSALNRLKSGYQINLIPFRNIYNMYLYDDRMHFRMNFVGNIVIFIPWGLLRPMIWKRQQKLVHVLLGAILLTLMIEFLQLFIWRTVDIDDIILNFGGTILGALLYLLIRKLIPGVRKLGR